MKSIAISYLWALMCLLPTFSFSQYNPSAKISGKVEGPDGAPLEFANVVLNAAADSSLFKVEVTGLDGLFTMDGVPEGQYWVSVSYVGLPPFRTERFQLDAGQQYELPVIQMQEANVELSEVVVTAEKPLVEVRADMMVFNVENTINASGSTAFELLRKAPGVVVDNNDNISLLGRAGVQVYIDGKPSPLSAADLSAFLKTMQSDEIEAIEVITNPSSRYDAEGNAGIINIRMKKDKRLGANANVNLGYSVGKVPQYNGSVSGNYRNRMLNVFGSYSHSEGENRNFMELYRQQLGMFYDQNSQQGHEWSSHNFKAGTDLFLGDKHTVGFLATGFLSNNSGWSTSRTPFGLVEFNRPDTVLLARNNNQNTRDNLNFNLNYRFDDKKGVIWNIDADYGLFRNDGSAFQPNYYLDPTETITFREKINTNETPTDIDIYTFKVDHERPLLGGQVGAGLKLARVTTDNTFRFFDEYDGSPVLNTGRSNRFAYEENINAGYVNYQRQLGKVGVQAGLRVEQTHALGDLASFREGEDGEAFDREYVDFFPSGGLTYAPNEKHSLQLTYSRRINRPSYQDLNPFLNKLDELTYEQGNPFLKPEYANNIQLTHSFNYRFNTTFSFSHTKDLITRITDTAEVNASYITWLNLADQYNYSLSISAPIPITKWWSSFTNMTGSYTQNKADYGDGKLVNLDATVFNIYSQHTFRLPHDFSLEVSGWYNSPSLWGGTFEMDAMWSMDAGVQKKILDGRGNIRLAVSDIFRTNEWHGVSRFGALDLDVRGGWDSRRFRVSFSYLLGNDQVKGARRRNTGLEEEQNRVKSGE
ncbi:MAG: TonB-dependent receptor [Lewinellaceae bacterium]|nr:TonB-dependent receptor [Phaeodactylibacter sp.]MCB0614160.1 TonB-dependent receptor [Phaeodactylibacter sp.]MCB9348933.1 TonB-dependent receptor [Lewinellaceae bacterium]